MANTKITELTQLTNPVSTDVLPIVDVGADVTKKISIADLLKNASAGTAEVPGIAFDGDINTGIYSPGADQVAISTGGTGRLFIDASGNVGVNTTSATAYGMNFAVVGTIGLVPSTQNTVGSSVSIKSQLGTSGGEEIVRNEITDFANGANYSTTTVFSTRNGASTSERMRLDSSGRLGVGTSSPQAMLSVFSPSAGFGAQIKISDQSEGAGTLALGDGLTSAVNVGIWRGAANSYSSTGNFLNLGGYSGISFATGNAAIGSQAVAMTIDTSQRVGIGTTTPSTYNANLAVYSAGGGFSSVLHSNVSGSFPKASAIALGSDAVSYTYSTNGGTVAVSGSAHIAAIQSASAGANTDIAFFNTLSGSVNEKARITSDGKLGLGTSAPDALFEASVSSSSIAYPVHITNAYNYGWGVGLKFRQRITSGGSLVDSAAITSHWISDNNSDLRFATTASGTLGTRLTITPAGNVGIGITSPLTRLHVADGGGITIQDTGGTERTTQVLQSGNTLYVDIREGANNGQLVIRGKGGGSASEYARFDTSGRLLVGTSSARSNFFNAAVSSRLQVEGGDTETSSIALIRNDNTSDSSRLIIAKSRSTGNTVVQSSDRVGGIEFQGNDGSEFVGAANIECYVDGTPGANDMPGRLVFSTTADGSASPTERMRITSDAYVRLASGTGGIQFNGDTAAANALDDYEEGTFTVEMEGTAGGTITLSPNTLTYTKVGKLVSINGRADISAISVSGTDVETLVTLPFGVASTTSFNDVIVWHRDVSASATNLVRIYNSSGQTQFKMRYPSNSFEVGDTVIFNFTYRSL